MPIMKSWGYPSEGKDLFLANNIDFSVDSLATTTKVLMSLDVNPVYDDIIVSTAETVERIESMEFGFPNIMKRSLGGDPCLGSSGRAIGDCSRSVSSPPCLLFEELASGDFHFKLGTLADGGKAQNGQCASEKSLVASPAKRARTMNLSSEKPVCQVYGCNKDLSFSKEYHKRHKVCDVHSKTAKVIVNGIEQRFCQQCSRFHLLAEFDDGKRSCRKRLAGHNERRRKPQYDVFSVKPQKLLQFYQGARLLGSSQAKSTSLVFPNKLSGCEHSNYCTHIHSDDQKVFIPCPKPCGTGEHSKTISSDTRYNSFDKASTILESSGLSNSSCALSLLSAQLRDSSSYSTSISMAGPHTFQSCSFAGQVSNFNFSIPSGIDFFENFLSDGSCLSGMTTTDWAGSPLFPYSGSAAAFKVQGDGILQKSDYLNSQCHLFAEPLPTVDLTQLSRHLERVEQQRNPYV